MNNLNKHAIAEFKAAGWLDDTGAYVDEMQEALCKHVLELLRVFADEGHSGSTAPYTVNMFKKLAMFEPLIPLTGEDWEWTEVSDGVFQNNRCGRVFKQADRFNGQAYDLDGRVFREPNGVCYTSRDSMVPITFPYVPKTEYVDVKGDSDE
jgi:hypothetical protein